MGDYIPLKQCAPGAIYEIHSRNLIVGVFNSETRGFIGIRKKFDSEYLFTEYHHDTGAPLGTVRPIRILGDLPEDMPLWERYPQSPCVRCGERITTEGKEPPYTRRHVYTELGPSIPCPDNNAVGWAGHTYTPLFNLLYEYQDDLVEWRWIDSECQEFLNEMRNGHTIPADAISHLSDDELIDMREQHNLSAWGLKKFMARIMGDNDG